MKKYGQTSFILYYISYILIILCIVILSVLSYIYLPTQWSYFWIFIALLILLFVSYFFKKKLFTIIHENYLHHIQSQVIDPIEIQSTLNYEYLYSQYKKLDYTLHYHDQDIVVFTKISADKIRKVFAHHILYVAVFNLKDSHSFYHPKVDDMINSIQHKSQTQDKKRVDRLLISQYKMFETFNESSRQQINEIIFIKTDKHIVSTINIGIFNKEHVALMLASKSYTPSLYYTNHVDELLHLLN